MATADAERIPAEVEAAWADLNAEVVARGEAGLEAPTVAGWSAKEMLAHAAFWAEAVEGFVTGMWRGQNLPAGWTFGSGWMPGEGSWPHYQEHNDREAAWGRAHTAREVLARLEEARRRLLGFVATVTAEEAQRDPQYWAEVSGHLREHAAELRGEEKRTLTRDGLLARVEATWQPFKAATDALGPAGISLATSAGWTAQELLAHAAFWDEAAVGAIVGMMRRLPMPPGWRFGSGYVPEPGDWPRADVHNAREAAWARGQPAEAVLARLETAHRGLVEVLETVTEDELAKDGDYYARLGGHYREHLPELLALLS
jgi:hypothetical protein